VSDQTDSPDPSKQDILARPSEQDILARLQRIFEESLNMSAPAPREDIIESGLLDSLALVTLLFEIEQQFGLEIPLESLEIDDFRNIAGIAQLLIEAASAP
jgi:D-alanine--poly(phosphoribitol) ligase subunit 2